MEEATWNLLDKGEKIAQEATVLKEELTGALEDVRKESEYSGPLLRSKPLLMLVTELDLSVVF